MSMMPDFIIPVEHAVQDFSEHLSCHSRTILSARYGDGKSYFLDAFMKNEGVKEEFQFIKLYPVNYQVLENRDIFEVIKYDILMQMGLQDMIDLSYKVSSRDAFFYCLKNHGLDLVESMFDVAGSIEGVSLVKAIGKIGKSTVGFVKVIKDAANEYKDYKAGDQAILDKYMDTTDGIAIYEEDLITKIIKDNLEKWRKKEENKNKKVVLLLEDMDRIDPAHLFRVMNIFSAHMDYSYKYSVKPDDSLVGNKFGFDNVVMVIHYENLRSIFAHFYGSETCFEGYIHKFADKGKFVYSLKAEAVNYYYECLSKISHLPEDILRCVLSEDRIKQRTLREMSNSLDGVEEQRKPIGDVKYDLTIVLACMRRLGLNDNEIISCINQAANQDMNRWMVYLYPYLKYLGLLKGTDIHLVDGDENKNGFSFQEFVDGVRIYATNYGSSSTFYKLDDIHNEILSLVIK